MQNPTKDEFVQEKRNKIGLETMYLLLGVITINGVITEFYVWAWPALAAIIIAYVAVLYFITRTIIKQAYFGTDYIPKGIVITFASSFVAGVLVIIGLVIQSKMYHNPPFQIIENGMVTYEIMLYLYTLISGIVFSAILIKKYRMSQ